MDQDTFTAEVRRVETQVGETGPAGPANPSGYIQRTDVTYEIGAMVDGAWVRFSSVPGTVVEALVARVEHTAPPEQEGPTMADVAPNPVPPTPTEPAAA